jgi:hypothetical protein
MAEDAILAQPSSSSKGVDVYDASTSVDFDASMVRTGQFFFLAITICMFVDIVLVV